MRGRRLTRAGEGLSIEATFKAMRSGRIAAYSAALASEDAREGPRSFAAGFVLIGLGFALFLQGAPKAPAVGQTMLAQTETIFDPVWVWLFFGEDRRRSDGAGAGPSAAGGSS